jgi:hypothetical protein
MSLRDLVPCMWEVGIQEGVDSAFVVVVVVVVVPIVVVHHIAFVVVQHHKLKFSRV